MGLSSKARKLEGISTLTYQLVPSTLPMIVGIWATLHSETGVKRHSAADNAGEKELSAQRDSK